MRTKNSIMQQLEDFGYVDSFYGFMNDRDVAIEAIQRNARNFIGFPKFHSDKEIILRFIVPHAMENLEYMSKSLKKDKDFAQQVLAINKKAIIYFYHQVQFSKQILDKVLNDPEFYSHPIYSLFIYENHREKFLKALENEHNGMFYANLIPKLQNKKDIVLSQLNRNLISVSDYLQFSEELKNDFEITFSLLKNINSQKFMFPEIIKRLYVHMNNNDKFEMCLNSYNKPICKHMIKLLMQNKNFKNEFYETYKNNKEIEDYRPLIREQNLSELLEENKDKVYKRPKI